MGYLSPSQIYKYASDIIKALGTSVIDRDPVYGEIEYFGSYYCGYGLLIDCTRKNDSFPLLIKYDEETVFYTTQEEENYTYKAGRWELVLKELFEAIPKELQKREDATKAKEKEGQFVKDCRKYVVRWERHETLSGFYEYGEYRDDKILITTSPFSIYERHKHKWLFWKVDEELVYGGANRITGDGEWRRYVESLIAKGKARALARKRKAEQKAAAEWAARPKPEDYINEIRNS